MPEERKSSKSALTQEERAELIDKTPKKWQERYAKSKSHQGVRELAIDGILGKAADSQLDV